MATYQLSICDGRSHAPFVYFSNGKRGKDNFCVVVTHRILTPEETQRWAKKIVDYYGSEAPLGRRGGTPGDYGSMHLEFMRYCLVWVGGTLAAAVDMDTLMDVTFASEREAEDCQPGSMEPAKTVHGAGMQSTLPSTTERAHRWREISFQTTTHGNVRVVLSTFRNPDLRNGIQMQPWCVTRDNAYGATVRPTPSRRLILKKFLRCPPHVPAGFASPAEVNAGEHFHRVTGHFAGSATEHEFMVPRGGRGAAKYGNEMAKKGLE